jgi:hypothetical protein
MLHLILLHLTFSLTHGAENCTAHLDDSNYCGTEKAGVCGKDGLCYCAEDYWHQEDL